VAELALDTLIGTGAEGVVAREGFARAVAGGAIDSALTLKLAGACRVRGHAAEACGSPALPSPGPVSTRTTWPAC